MVLDEESGLRPSFVAVYELLKKRRIKTVINILAKLGSPYTGSHQRATLDALHIALLRIDATQMQQDLDDADKALLSVWFDFVDLGADDEDDIDEAENPHEWRATLLNHVLYGTAIPRAMLPPGHTGHKSTLFQHSDAAKQTGFGVTARTADEEEFYTVCTASQGSPAHVFAQTLAVEWEYVTDVPTFYFDIDIKCIRDVVNGCINTARDPIDLHPRRFHHVELQEHCMSLLVDGAIAGVTGLRRFAGDVTDWFAYMKATITKEGFTFRPHPLRERPIIGSYAVLTFHSYAHRDKPEHDHVSCQTCADLLSLIFDTMNSYYGTAGGA